MFRTRRLTGSTAMHPLIVPQVSTWLTYLNVKVIRRLSDRVLSGRKTDVLSGRIKCDAVNQDEQSVLSPGARRCGTPSFFH